MTLSERAAGPVRPFEAPTPERVRDFLASVPKYAADADDPTLIGRAALDERRERLLQRQMGWLHEASPYYRDLFARERVDVAAVRTPADLRRLPVTTKADYMADPERFRLRFDVPSLYDQTHSLMYTTGTTTGRPTPYPLTGHDMMGSILGMARGMKQAYFVPGDLVVSAFPYSPTAHLTGLSPHYFNNLGCAFLACFTGAPYPEFAIHNGQAYVGDAVERFRATVIIGVASFVRRMVRDAANQGRDFSSVRIAYVSGEVCTQRMRDDIRSSLRACGAETVFVTTPYSFTEATVAWTECRELGWWHLAAPDQIYCEVVDPKSHEPLPPGARGLLLITHLNRRGAPLVRYAPGDLTAIVEEPCPDCGRYTQSMVITEGSTAVLRTTDLVKIKGTLLNPQLLASVVGNTEGVLEYQIVFDRQDPDDPLSDEVLRLRVAADGHVDEQHLRDRLRENVFESCEMRPTVEFVAPSEIFDPSVHFKALRILDRRPRGE